MADKMIEMNGRLHIKLLQTVAQTTRSPEK